MLKLFKNQKGAGLVEYALLVALIAIASIAALNTLQGSVSGTFKKIGTELDKH